MKKDQAPSSTETTNCDNCNAPNLGFHVFCCACGAGLKPHIGSLASAVLRAQLPLVLKEHLKDASLVEMEIAEKALDRVIKWAKYAAIVLSAPIALLGFLGVKGFMDVSATYEKISKQLTDLETKATSVGTQINSIGSRADGLIKAGDKISVAYRDIDAKLGEYKKIDSKLAALQNQVTNLEGRIPSPRVEQFDTAVDVMARTIFGEARGVGRDGMEGIAAVIANRANASANADQAWFGKTIEAVCLKPHQFSTWNKDDPNRARIEAVTANDPGFALALTIAKQAILGELIDRTRGATLYHPTQLPALPAWARNAKPTVQIGPLMFYRAFAEGERR